MDILSAALALIAAGATEGSGQSTKESKLNVTTLAMRVSSLVPRPNNYSNNNAIAFKASPHCITEFSFPPAFTACQAKTWEQKQVSFEFSLSPSMKQYIYNSNNINSSIQAGWSWFQWLLSNELGTTTDISALALLQPTTFQLLNVTGTVQEKGFDRRLHINREQEIANHTLPGAAVCVLPPFIFLLSNDNNGSTKLDCKNDSIQCFLSECWNGSFGLAVVLPRLYLFP